MPSHLSGQIGGCGQASLLVTPAWSKVDISCNTRAAADTDGPRGDRLVMAERVEREQSVESIVEPMVARLLSPAAQAEAHIVDPVRGRIRRCTPAGIAFAQRAMAARPDSTGLLASIDVPALVIAGAQDAIVDASEVGAMAGSIPGARYAELDCGHLSNLEIPRAFNQRLADFLAPARMTS